MSLRYLDPPPSAAAWPIGVPEDLCGEIAMDFHHCLPAALADIAFVRATLLHAAEAAGAVIETGSFHAIEPAGICGTVLVADGHFSVQCSPLRGHAAVQVFTTEPLRLSSVRCTLTAAFQSH
ncbi:MAG: S-adenosylmethionine decarboxylase [Roseococcus sp.]